MIKKIKVLDKLVPIPIAWKGKLKSGLTEREKIFRSRHRGISNERQIAMRYRLAGWKVYFLYDNTKGYDFIAVRINPFNGEVEIAIVECKAGRKSRLTKAQIEFARKHPELFKEERNILW